jgi:hypothetical protein
MISGTIFAVIGLVGGYYIGLYFESQKRQDAIQSKVNEAIGVAVGEAVKAAQEQFDSLERDKVEERFGPVVEAIRSEAREAGRVTGIEECRADPALSGQDAARQAGFDEGYTLGYSTGQRDTSATAQLGCSDLVARLEAAQNDWFAYASVLERLAGLSEGLSDATGNSDIQQDVLSTADGLVAAANALREAHQSQASAFNSTIDDLQSALESRNFPEIRRLIGSLQASIQTKKEIFLGGEKRILETFESIAAK